MGSSVAFLVKNRLNSGKATEQVGGSHGMEGSNQYCTL